MKPDKNIHAVELGKLGGKSKSLAKRVAAQSNGKLGGRPVQKMDITGLPLAVAGLKSYRYRGNYGYIMIGAKDTLDALSEANRSLEYGLASIHNLEFWNGQEYQAVEETR